MQIQPGKLLIESETKDHYVIVYYRNNIIGDEGFGSVGGNVFIYDIYQDEQASNMRMVELSILDMSELLSDYVGKRCKEIEDRTI